MTQPISTPTIATLLPYYATRKHRTSLEEQVKTGLDWAIQPLSHTVALLAEEAGGLRATDLVMDRLANSTRPVPVKLWKLALDAATASESMAIGYRADDLKEILVAREAWERPPPQATPAPCSTSGICTLTGWIRPISSRPAAGISGPRSPATPPPCSTSGICSLTAITRPNSKRLAVGISGPPRPVTPPPCSTSGTCSLAAWTRPISSRPPPGPGADALPVPDRPTLEEVREHAAHRDLTSRRHHLDHGEHRTSSNWFYLVRQVSNHSAGGGQLLYFDGAESRLAGPGFEAVIRWDRTACRAKAQTERVEAERAPGPGVT
jgi:hypothetical protein